MTPGEEVHEKIMPCEQTKLQGVVVPITRSRHSFFCVENEDVLIFLKEGYRNPTGFRRWVKVAQSCDLCYTCVMGIWESKNRHKYLLQYHIISYASIERNCRCQNLPVV